MVKCGVWGSSGEKHCGGTSPPLGSLTTIADAAKYAHFGMHAEDLLCNSDDGGRDRKREATVVSGDP